MATSPAQDFDNELEGEELGELLDHVEENLIAVILASVADIKRNQLSFVRDDKEEQRGF